MLIAFGELVFDIVNLQILIEIDESFAFGMPDNRPSGSGRFGGVLGRAFRRNGEARIACRLTTGSSAVT